MSVLVVAHNGCSDASTGEKAGTCTKCAQADDLWHVDEFQEIVNRLEVLHGLKQSQITWLLEWGVFNCSTGY